MNEIPACNPQLKTWRRNIAATVAGAGHIEVPGRFQNVVWQSRPEVPGEYELALAAALESVFDAGAVEVADIIAGLNTDSSAAASRSEEHTSELQSREN